MTIVHAEPARRLLALSAVPVLAVMALAGCDLTEKKPPPPTLPEVSIPAVAGSIRVSKVIVDPPVTDTAFTVHVECRTGPAVVLDAYLVFEWADGDLAPTNQTVGNIPSFYSCSVQELATGGGASVAYQPNGGSLDQFPVISPSAGETVDVTITNTFSGGE